VSRSPVPPPPAGASRQPAGQPASDASQHGNGDSAPSSVRAQLLATEHWSLLATRSTAQSEVLSRITTFLMLVSASIVSLALIGQATRFGGRFTTFALLLLGPNPTQPLASSWAFIVLVNSGLSGVFAGLVAVALDAPGPLVGVVAAACGLAFLGISLTLGVRQYQRMQRRYVALFPTPDGSSQPGAQEARA
jgi:hypothetical protein